MNEEINNKNRNAHWNYGRQRDTGGKFSWKTEWLKEGGKEVAKSLAFCLIEYKMLRYQSNVKSQS